MNVIEMESTESFQIEQKPSNGSEISVDGKIEDPIEKRGREEI